VNIFGNSSWLKRTSFNANSRTFARGKLFGDKGDDGH